MAFVSIQTDAVYEGGVLRPLTPLDLREHEVVTVSISPAGQSLTPDEWRKRVLETAGKWQGDFERPEQGEYEKRDSLS